MLSAIVAVSENGVIGDSQHKGLLWNIPSELAYFREVTRGRTLLMGRKTWESLPKRPLPNRKHIVLTGCKLQDHNGNDMTNNPWVTSFSDHQSLVEFLNKQTEEVVVIGGGQIYKLFLPLCGRVYLTRVHKNVRGDVTFPTLDMHEWRIEHASAEPIMKEGDEASYTIYVFSRVKGGRQSSAISL